MTDLFNRDISVTIGTTKIAARVVENGQAVARPTLRMAFSVEKSGASSPNKAELTVYNLNETHRQSLKETQPCIIEAGYVQQLEQIFSGDISYAASNKESTAWVTKIQLKDGGEKYASARINKSFGPGTQLTAVLNQAAKALGVGLGNSSTAFNDIVRGLKQFTKGVAVSGKVSDILDKYVSTAGLQWSIQDGQLQVLKPEETTQQQVLLLSPTSGLIGSPELGEKGIVKARTLLLGGLVPGRRVKFESLTVTGFFKLERVRHYGDTWGTDWYSELEAKPL